MTYVLAGEWLARRQMLAALGVSAEGLDLLDTDLAEAVAAAAQPDPPAANRAARSAQIAAFVAASGM
jgi:hypothetical protein